MTKKLILLLACVCVAFQTWAQEQTYEISIKKPKKEIPVQSNMYGVFFEDINFGADGGLYAELIKNRSFDFTNSPTMGWLTYGDVSVETTGAPFERNPNYLRLTNSGLLTGTGVINEGFRGIGVKEGEMYQLSFYARSIDSEAKNLRIELISSGAEIMAHVDMEVTSGDWEKYSVELSPAWTDPHAKLRIDLRSLGSIDLEHVSLFPEKTFKGRENGMRQDLAQALADLKPGIFRFPGGCIIEGNSLEMRYQWKNSVGLVENRPVLENRWNYEFQHRFTPDYFQSYGLGFYEYFLLCEDLGADALPVVNCGIACQYATEEVCEDLEPYIQDALDLIEFANGPVTSGWGKVRAEMGHPEPFNMKMIGIGNEQWGEDFPNHLEQFMKAIYAKYPDMLVIGSSGPSADGEQFDYLWDEMKRLDVDLVDEHYYKDPEWFLNSADRYDSYDRKGPKVFAGEYACHDHPQKKNSFYSALCEAAFMTGLERNADVVHLATYAPLFAHVDAWQWKPDMIWFDNLRLVKSANYYVQQLYAHHKGTRAMDLTWNKENLTGQDGLYASSVIDDEKDQLIIKIVNTSKESKTVNFDFSKLKLDKNSGKQITLMGDLEVENTLDNPDLIAPTEKAISISGTTLKAELEPESFHVFVLK